MDPEQIGETLRNLDQRVDRIEQFLPTLATTAELANAVAKLATKEELVQKIEEDGARSRRHMDVLVEHLESKIEVFAEKILAVDQRDARQHADTIKRHTALDKRVTILEASRPKRRA